MVHGQGSTIINRPVEEVFAFLPVAVTNPSLNNPRLSHAAFWQQVPAGVIEKGTTFTYQPQEANMQTITEVIGFEPNQSISLQQNTSGCLYARGVTRYNLEPAAEGTRVTITMEAEAKGWLWLIFAVFNLPGMNKLAIVANLRALKGRIEAQPFITVGYRSSGPLPALDAIQFSASSSEEGE